MAGGAKARFASPGIAKEVARIFGDEAFPVKVKMRPGKDLAQFIRKVKKANDEAARSKLSFD